MAEDKIFKFRGKTLEELQALSIEELAPLMTSDFRRKLKRGFTEQEQIFLSKVEKSNSIKTHIRELFVVPSMVGKKISIYSGKEFVEVPIVAEMIGMRFGELVPSRKIAVHTTLGNK